MLVLTRKPKETIQIGDGITVTLVRVRGQMVRLGIEAPRDVRIVRGELLSSEPTGSLPEPMEESVLEAPRLKDSCCGQAAPNQIVADCATLPVRCPAARDATQQRAAHQSTRRLARTSLRALAARKLEQLNECDAP